MGKTRDLFKKTGYTTWIFHENMGTIKERNVKKLTEAEDIKKRWQEYTEDLSKKCLNDSDNHDSVVTSVQFCHSVVSHSLWPHESQGGQASLSITSSRSAPKPMSIELVMPSNHLILCRPLLLPATRSFPMSQLFTWAGQSTGVSASASVLPVKTQEWSPLGWTGWIFLQFKGFSRVFSNTTVQTY